jgi:hypothetical protein
MRTRLVKTSIRGALVALLVSAGLLLLVAGDSEQPRRIQRPARLGISVHGSHSSEHLWDSDGRDETRSTARWWEPDLDRGGEAHV